MSVFEQCTLSFCREEMRVSKGVKHTDECLHPAFAYLLTYLDLFTRAVYFELFAQSRPI